MKINTSIIVSGITLLAGLFSQQPYLWFPVSVLAAGIIDLFTRGWVASDRLGSATNLSVLLKSICSVAVLYAMVGQVICIGLLIWWFVF